MSNDFTHTIMAVRKAGPNRVRSVPMAAQNAIDGLYQLEILSEDNNQWQAVATGLPRQAIDDIIANATNRLVLG